MKELAVAILNYRMPELVESMGNQLYKGPYDCFLFSNGGGPVRCNWATVITWPDNLMFSGGWNMAMRFLAEYEYVWMLNDDLEGLRQSIAGHVLSMWRPGLAAATPAFNSPHAIFHWRKLVSGGNSWRTSWIDWCCPIVCMDAWRDVGPFDERFVGYGADLDWCKRARFKGWEFMVVNTAGIRHRGSATALKHGLQGMQGNVAEMNRLLKEKWGVRDWTQMT